MKQQQSTLVLMVAGVFAICFLLSCKSSEESEQIPMETLPMNQISLETLDEFESVSENWTIVEGVEVDKNFNSTYSNVQQ